MNGLCECGCGQRTTISPYSHTAKGYIQGQPRRFRPGHGQEIASPPADVLRRLYVDERRPMEAVGATYGASRSTAKKHLIAAGIPLRRSTPPPRDPLDRLRSFIVETDAGCWQWQGHLDDKGYGKMGVSGRTRRVHQVAYELIIGPVPDGRELDHLCRNPACCNPAHLEPVTHRENILRGNGPPARNALKTHCKHGHEFTEDNILRVRSRPNARHCRTCNREQTRKRKRKR